MDSVSILPHYTYFSNILHYSKSVVCHHNVLFYFSGICMGSIFQGEVAQPRTELWHKPVSSIIDFWGRGSTYLVGHDLTDLVPL